MMVLNVRTPTVRILDTDENGISGVAMDVTEDDGLTFSPVVIRYNPAMLKEDLLRVLTVAHAKVKSKPTPTVTQNRILTTLGDVAKPYEPPSPKPEPIPKEVP